MQVKTLNELSTTMKPTPPEGTEQNSISIHMALVKLKCIHLGRRTFINDFTLKKTYVCN